MPSGLIALLDDVAMIAKLAGTVAALDQRKSARGTRFAFVRLSDPTGLFEVRMFSDVLDQVRELLHTHPQTQGQTTYTLPYHTEVFWCERL